MLGEFYTVTTYITRGVGGLEILDLEIANPRLTKNYFFSAYRSSCNGTLWPVGHLLHLVVSYLIYFLTLYFYTNYCKTTKKYVLLGLILN